MAAALAGSLVDVRPRTLLHFLGLTGKSGVLRVGDARVELRHGRVVGDAVDDVVAMIRRPHGSFSFEERPVAPGVEARAVEDVLAHANEVLADWEEVAQAVPSTAVEVRLRQGDGDARLSADAEAVGVAVAGGLVTPARLAVHLGWPVLRVGRAVKELVDVGRAEVAPPPRPQRPGAPTGRPLWPGQADEPWRVPWYDGGE